MGNGSPVKQHSRKNNGKLSELADDYTAKLKLFSDIVEKSPDGVQIIDLDGFILYSNHAISGMFGFTKEELKGKPAGFLNPNPSVIKKTILPSIKKTGRWDGELIARHKDGSSFPVWIASFTAYDEKKNPHAIISIIRDLTERKIVEIAFQHSQQKYSNLFQHSSDAIIIYDLNGNILDANKKVLEQFGLIKKNILALSVFDLLPASENKKFRALLKAIGKNGHAHCETYFISCDGQVFPAEFTSSLFYIGEENVVQGIIRNIFERRKTEEEIKKQQEKLEEQVRERTLELLEANENLQVEIKVRKQVEKKLLIYQKQLQSLSSQIALIEEREKRRIASELHDCIGQTLALAKIKIGLLNKLFDSPELKHNIKEILLLLEETINGTRTLTFELSPPILYELGILQAITWLVDQFTKKHGIHIELETNNGDIPFDNNIRYILFQAVRELLMNIIKHAQATKVRINMLTNNHVLKIVVEDNGIGYSKSPEICTGYGLFNIRERINHIKGHFEIKSFPGSGTRVTLVTPLQYSK